MINIIVNLTLAIIAIILGSVLSAAIIIAYIEIRNQKQRIDTKNPKCFHKIVKEKYQFEKYLKKLMDKGYLREWYYNGCGNYHVCFKHEDLNTIQRGNNDRTI